MPDSERERRLEEIYSAAMRQDAGIRAEFLRQACGGDTALCQEIESLLGDERKLGGFLEKPALETAAFSAAGARDHSLVGQTLGPYNVLSLLGAGGMGEVYSARDRRLGRLVALKVLQPDVAADPQRQHRLLLEARAASALNDPHIVALYDVGSAEGIDFLVMEYVPGETLDKLIACGKLEIEQTLTYAIAIAGAVATAHKAGIVHRDLKPGNVMITQEAAVKVLDFGLAKLTEAPPACASDASGSLVSIAGLILGTAAYMSPEQAQAQPVDARSDIFSFGVVLYEMLTGQRPFQGSDRTSTLAAIARQEPRRLTELNPKIPGGLEHVVLNCLCKDPNERFQDMADVKAALEGLRPATPALRRRFLTGLVAALIAILVASVAAYQWTRSHPERAAPRSLPERQLTANAPEARVESAAISPDGKYVAYQDRAGLFLRALDSGEARPVRIPAELRDRAMGTLDWFPDGEKLLVDTYYESAIWVVPIRGEAPAQMLYSGQEPTLAADGRSIAFLKSSRQELWVGGIDRASPHKLADREEKDSLFHPAWSPDGRWLAYWNVRGWPRTITIEVRPAAGGPPKTLVPGSNLPATSYMTSGSMIWSPDWRLIFALNEASGGVDRDINNDGIWTLRVEPSKCEARGKPERLTPRLGWFLRNLTITADGKRLAFVKGRTQWDVYVAGLERGGSSMAPPRRLTLDTRGSVFRIWTLDSQAVLYYSRRNGKNEIFTQGLTETVPKLLVESSESVCCPALTPDGLWLLYWEVVPGGRSLQRLMRRPVAAGPPEMVMEIPTTEWLLLSCPETPGRPCALSQREGQYLVFYSFDPVRSKGDRIGKIEIQTKFQRSPKVEWSFSLDGSRLGVVDGQSRIAVLTLADRAWHEIPVPPRWGGLTAIGTAADDRGFTVVAASHAADYILNVTAAGKVDLLFRKDPAELRLREPLYTSPDGRHLAFGTSSVDTNAWMIENF